MTNIIVTGDKELDRKLATMTERMQKKLVRRAVRPIAKEIQASAKSFAPEEHGDLRDAIRVRALKRSRKDKNRVGVRVGTSESDSLFSGEQFYGGFQEFGTKNMEPNEFMEPAYHENEQSAQTKFASVLRRVVEEERE